MEASELKEGQRTVLKDEVLVFNEGKKTASEDVKNGLWSFLMRTDWNLKNKMMRKITLEKHLPRL